MSSFSLRVLSFRACGFRSSVRFRLRASLPTAAPPRRHRGSATPIVPRREDTLPRAQLFFGCAPLSPPPHLPAGIGVPEIQLFSDVRIYCRGRRCCCNDSNILPLAQRPTPRDESGGIVLGGREPSLSEERACTRRMDQQDIPSAAEDAPAAILIDEQRDGGPIETDHAGKLFLRESARHQR